MNKWQSVAAAAIVAAPGSSGGPVQRRRRPATPAAQTKPEGEMRFALYVTVPPAWLDPGEAAPSFTSPFWVTVRAARRAGEADAGPAHGAEPRRVLEREPGQAEL